MDKRGFQYDSSEDARQHAMNVQMAKQALEMEEAIYLHRQQELDRDIQLQRLLLQEHLQNEALSNAGLSNPLASFNASRLYLGGGFGGGGLAQYEQEFLLQQQEQIRRQRLQQQLHAAQTQSQAQAQAQQQQQQQQVQSQKASGNNASASNGGSEMTTDKLVAASLAANAVRRTSSGGGQRKKSVDKSCEVERPPTKRKARSDSTASEKGPKNDPPSKKPKAAPKQQRKPRQKSEPSQPKAALAKKAKIENKTESLAIEALTAVGTDLDPNQYVPIIKGTLESLLSAAENEEKADLAAQVMAKLRSTVAIGDLDDEPQYAEGEIIDLPNFKSKLPLLPSEPEYKSDAEESCLSIKEGAHAKSQVSALKSSSATPKAAVAKPTPLSMTVDYPYPVDTWWPSISTIRKERRARGDKSDEEDFNDEPPLKNEPDVAFRADIREIHKRLATEIEPGVLEKVPHCRIHRMAMKSLKVANAPDHAFCWQVTENYCNDPMVCCSICSTWRHARCGGHFKPMTVRELAAEPFAPVCDRCHAEEGILREYPKASVRVERQRIEQLRRGLSTSSVIRQASFSKHGATYKWPLGSVSSTHIGGHTRSVHSRHDKAEKQWSEMVTRLARVSGYRPKERVKVRTRELERLLVSIEDAEGATDRHNMMMFLYQDINGDKKPVGYEKLRKNIFDPEDDEILSEDNSRAVEESMVSDQGASEEYEIAMGRRVAIRNSTATGSYSLAACAQPGCHQRPRFDSVFCSDACGVKALQTDLLQAFQYASDIHPALLR